MKVRIEAEEGLVSHYNGIEIVQSRDYIKIHVEGYIDKILDGHGWSTPSSTEGSTVEPVEPVHPNTINELETTIGPKDPKAAAALATSSGFGYRKGIGELIYAYATCRVDIGYATVGCSTTSVRPSRMALCFGDPTLAWTSPTYPFPIVPLAHLTPHFPTLRGMTL
jgi:hypothetical protein